jgi:tetratricopeptide (TPR) repeat protein
VRFISLLLITLLITGCTAGPKKPPPLSKRGDTASTTDAKVNATASKLPVGPATPNPYLQDLPAVSRATQQQFNDAVTAIEQKNWPQAERLLLRLSSEQPRLSGVQLNLGLVYRALNDPAKATTAFQQAININPKNLSAYNQLAVLKRQTGDFVAAEKLYQQALAVWPYHPESHKNIAILYDLYLGKEQQALAHYEAYKALVGDNDKQLESWIADLQRRLATPGGG